MWVEFNRTGKLNIKTFVNIIQEELARIAWKKYLAQPAADMFGSILGIFGMAAGGGFASGGGSGSGGAVVGSMFGSFGLAGGGRAAAGSLHEVNEEGPEILTMGGRDFLMMGSRAGNVVPNGQSMQPVQAQSVVFSPVINIDSRTDRAEVAGLVRAAVRSGQAELLEMMDRRQV
jgi:lambda family phage tail tape measure protein